MKKLMNKVLLALFGLLLSGVAVADPVGGSKSDTDVSIPGIAITYTVNLDGRPTVFIVEGDGDGDIDCIVYDAYGNTVAHDARINDGCSIMLNRGEWGMHRLVLRNEGSIPSRFVMRVF
jgi:hypothetical protein